MELSERVEIIMALGRFKDHIGNVLLALGAMMLLMVGVVEFAGSDSDPLLAALAALAIGVTAIIDRMGAHRHE